MCSKSVMKQSTVSSSIERLREALDTADAVFIGAGAGLSTSAGLTYSGERFERYFSDFYRKYGTKGVPVCSTYCLDLSWTYVTLHLESLGSGRYCRSLQCCEKSGFVRNALSYAFAL